ncbi:hypothetical protein AMECASPLE_030622, partial [Ameca splendens]
MGKEMEDALRKMATEAVPQATTPPKPLKQEADPPFKPDPKSPSARLGVDFVSMATRVYLVGWGDKPEKPQEPLGTSSGETQRTPFLKFLGELTHNKHACRLYCLTVIGGCVKVNALLDTGSEISLMCSALFDEVSRAVLDLAKPFQVEGCDISITGYTQDRSYISSRVWLDVSFQDMTLVHPIYNCTLDTEPLLVSQDLLNRLAPLIDCHLGPELALEVPKPLRASSKPPFATNQVSSLEGPKEPLAGSCLRQSQSRAPLVHDCTRPPRELHSA